MVFQIPTYGNTLEGVRLKTRSTLRDLLYLSYILLQKVRIVSVFATVFLWISASTYPDVIGFLCASHIYSVYLSTQITITLLRHHRNVQVTKSLIPVIGVIGPIVLSNRTVCLESRNDRIWGSLYLRNLMEFCLRNFSTPREPFISVAWRQFNIKGTCLQRDIIIIIIIIIYIT